MKKILLFIILISCSFLYATEANKILIGNPISLEIKGVSIEQIKNSFSELQKERDIKLESLKEKDTDKDVIVATFRCFSVGENILKISNKNIKIIVASSLSEDEKTNDIYLDASNKENKKLYWYKIPYKTFLGIIIFFFSFMYLIKNIRFKKSLKIVDPSKRFEDGMKYLSKEKWQFDISYLLREFIDSKFANTHFLSGDYRPIKCINKEDIDFIQQLDNYKFAREVDDLESYKEKTIKKAFNLYNKIKGDIKENA